MFCETLSRTPDSEPGIGTDAGEGGGWTRPPRPGLGVGRRREEAGGPAGGRQPQEQQQGTRRDSWPGVSGSVKGQVKMTRQVGRLSSRYNLYSGSCDATYIFSAEAGQKHLVLLWAVTIK